LEEVVAWRKLGGAPTATAISAFLSRFPSGRFAKEARAILRSKQSTGKPGARAESLDPDGAAPPSKAATLRRKASSKSAAPVTESKPTPLGDGIACHIPDLRRYARLLSHSQERGDRESLNTIQRVVEAASTFPEGPSKKSIIFRFFHDL